MCDPQWVKLLTSYFRITADTGKQTLLKLRGWMLMCNCAFKWERDDTIFRNLLQLSILQCSQTSQDLPGLLEKLERTAGQL